MAGDVTLLVGCVCFAAGSPENGDCKGSEKEKQDSDCGWHCAGLLMRSVSDFAARGLVASAERAMTRICVRKKHTSRSQPASFGMNY